MQGYQAAGKNDNKIQAPKSIICSSALPQESHMNTWPQMVKAKVDQQTNSITCTVRDFDVVMVSQSFDVLRHRCPITNCQGVHSDNDEVASMTSKNRIQESEEKSSMQHEIVRKDEHSNLTKNVLAVVSDTSTMISRDYITDVDPPLPLIKKQGYLNGKECEKIIEKLVHLQDNGKFKEHATSVQTYLKLCKENRNFDMELALLLEQGVALSYQRKFKKSKRLFTSIISRAKNPLRNEKQLMARAHYLIVDNCVDRFRKVTKLQSMQECLKRSLLLLQNIDSPQDWAELYYTFGNLGQARLSTMPMSEDRHDQARRVVQNESKHYFELAIACCKKDSRLRIQTKLQRYCHLKVAQLLLDCCSTAALHRRNVLPPKQIEEAKQHLDFVAFEFGTEMPLGTRVELMQTRCDQFYRQGKFQLAKETAEEAYSLAGCNSGFYFLDALEKRIEFLSSLCENRIRLVADNEFSSCSSDASCEASSSDPE